MRLTDPTIGSTAPPRVDGPLAIGATLGERYRVLEYLGRGGMGVVYRARDTQLCTDIALKLVAPEVSGDPDRLEALRAEVRLARLVTHPNVCRIHDLEQADAELFVTMELIDGESVQARLEREGCLPLEAARRILHDVVVGLIAIHASGVVHRDLKLSNVLLDAATGRAIIADFGVAFAIDRGSDGIAGTPGYMAPEQAAGAAVDARADVFALGALARRMLGDGELARFVAACTAADPSKRPDLQTAMGMLAAPRRGRSRRIAGVLVFALAVIAATVLRWPSDEPSMHPIAFDASALKDSEHWLGDALAARVRNELDDAWGIALEAAGTPLVRGRLRRETSGRIVLESMIGGISAPPRAGSLDELASAIAAEVAQRQPATARHPTQDELVAIGAREPEAWRAMRRAQRHGMMQRWHEARPLALAAVDRDRTCSVCALVLALCFDTTDTQGIEAIRTAVALPGGAPHWRFAIGVAERSWTKPDPDLPRDAARLLAMEMPDRDRRWMFMRVAAARYDGGAITEALALLERIAELWPLDAAAPKYLADHYLRSDASGSAPVALRWAERAVAHAPDDLTARALLARAYARAGRLDDARRETARIDAADADLKRPSSRHLFELHLMLGQPDLAEQDARRLLTGTSIERAQAARLLGALELYWGRFDRGLDAIEGATREYDVAGREGLGDDTRLDGAAEALALGERARARSLVTPIVQRHPVAAALLAILDGRADAARAAVERAPQGLPRDALAIVVDVALRRDAAAIARYRARGGEVPVEALAALAEVQARTRDPALVEVPARLIAHPQAWRREVAAVRARVELGRAAIARDDREGAAVMFREVLARWQRGAPSSDAVKTARLELDRLR